MNTFTMPLALFLSIASIAVFSFVAIVSWSDIRRREREAYYKSESLKKIAEMPGDSAVAMLREVERAAMRRQREGVKLGGLITNAAGIALMVFLRAMAPDRAVYLAGLIALLIGAALLAYAYFLAPQD